MPPVPHPALASAHTRATSGDGRASRKRVWALTLVGIVLLAPVLIINAPRKPPPKTATADVWLEFAGPGFATIVFREAQALAIPLELIRPAPTNDDENDAIPTTDEEAGKSTPVPAADPLRWLDGHAPPLRSLVDPSRIQYKLDPSFGFENRTLRTKGMMIRLRIEF